jgi:hypothetical protein
MTAKQYRMLESFLEECENTDLLVLPGDSRKMRYYDLDVYSPADIIKRIRKFFVSGVLEEDIKKNCGDTMKFILNEELLEDLKSDESRKEEVIRYASKVLTADGFEEIDELNGVSFAKSYESKEETIHCQFYLDTESEKYSSYVTTEENGDKSTTFQQHGSIFDAESAIDEFFEFVNKIEQ